MSVKWYDTQSALLRCHASHFQNYVNPFRDSQETNQSQSNPQAVEPEPAEEGVRCLGSKLHAK